MSEIFDIGKNRDSLTNMLLIKAITDSDKIEEIIRKCGNDGHSITLIVNGVEIPFTNTMHNLEELINDLANEKANELIKDRFNDELSKIHETLHSAGIAIKDKLNEVLKINDD